MTATYKVYVDWDNDGDFSEAYEDITSYISKLKWIRGKDSDYGYAITGRLEMTLIDPDADFSPELTTGAFYGEILPRRLVRVTANPGTGAINQFTGYLEKVIPDVRYSRKSAYIVALDGMDHLAREELETVLWKGHTTGALVKAVAYVADFPKPLISSDLTLSLPLFMPPASVSPFKADTGQDFVIYGGIWSLDGITFDGSDDYLEAEAEASLEVGTGDFTIELWLKTSTATANEDVINKGAVSVVGYKVETAADGTITATIRDSGGEVSVSSASGFNDDEWHHVAIVFDRDGNAQIYVDGAASGSPVDISSYGGALTNDTRPFRVGCAAPSTDHWLGSVGEIRIYASALVAAGIRHNYAVSKWRYQGTIEEGQDTVPYAYWSKVKAITAHRELAESEIGLFYIDRSGAPVFESRWHRFLPAQQTSQHTFSDTMIDLPYVIGADSVRNEIRVTVTPWELQPIAELWRLQETASIAPGERRTWWGDSQYSVEEWVTPGRNVAILRPNGAGDETGISGQHPSSGSHYDKVDEEESDGNDTFLYPGLPGSIPGSLWERDLFELEDAGLSSAILGVKVYFVARRANDGISTVTAKAAIKTHGTVYEGDEKTLTTSWGLFSQTWELNPFTGSAWTPSEIDDLQAGVALKSQQYFVYGSYASCTQLYAAVTYVDSGEDLSANSQADGLGDDLTNDISMEATGFAKSIKLELTNNSSQTAYITLLRARGSYYDDQSTVTLKAEDADSQRDYEKRTLSVEGKFLTDTVTAQSYADYSLAKLKDPQAEISLVVVNKNSTLLEQILTREISDRVTVVNTRAGISKDYFINKMEHNVELGSLRHTVEFTLVDASNEDFWCLGYSALGIGTKLGY